jgi:hypothetical protein
MFVPFARKLLPGGEIFTSCFDQHFRSFQMLHNFEMHSENTSLQVNDFHKTHNIGNPDQITTAPPVRREVGGRLN